MEILKAGMDDFWITIIFIVFWAVSALLERMRKKSQRPSQHRPTPTTTEEAETIVREAPYRSVPTNDDLVVDIEDLFTPEEHRLEEDEHAQTEAAFEETANPERGLTATQRAVHLSTTPLSTPTVVAKSGFGALFSKPVWMVVSREILDPPVSLRHSRRK